MEVRIAGLALQSFLCLEPFADVGVDALQPTLELLQPLLGELFGRGGAQVLAAVGDGDPVLDQPIPDQLELGTSTPPVTRRPPPTRHPGITIHQPPPAPNPGPI